MFKNKEKNISPFAKYKNVKEGVVQNYLPIKDIAHGMIYTTDKRYISILEIQPIDFYKKSIKQQTRIISNFKRLFIGEFEKARFMTMCAPSSTKELINSTIESYKFAHSTPLKDKYCKNYLSKIDELGQNLTLSKRFFVMYEYEGEDGIKASSIDKIEQEMLQKRRSLIGMLAQCGNTCIEPDNLTLFLYEFVYMYCNRLQYIDIPFKQRFERVTADFEKYNLEHPENQKTMTACDLIAPRGLYLANKSYFYMSGLYYTFLTLRGDKYPGAVSGGWLDNFLMEYPTNLDIILDVKKNNTQIAQVLATNAFNDARLDVDLAASKNHSYQKNERILKKYNERAAFKKDLDTGNDLWDCCIVIAIRATRVSDLNIVKRKIMKAMVKYKLKFEQSFLNMEAYFQFYFPIMYRSVDVFDKNAHSITTTAMGDFYNYTSEEITDSKGIVLGQLADNSSMLVINNFNRKRFSAPHIVITGASGTGKTYTEQLIGLRKSLLGERCFFIIPAKGFEYKGAVELAGGEYIKLSPSSPHCINIFDIRPEQKIDMSLLEEDVVFSEKSLLGSKISFLLTWFQMLMSESPLNDKESSILTQYIRQTYEVFGITDDNNSIYDFEGNLRPMPILSNFLDQISSVSALERLKDVVEAFINGVGKCLNGQTNVNIYSLFIVFDVDQTEIGEKYLPCFMYPVTQTVFEIVKGNTQIYDNIFLDEEWLMLQGACAPEIKYIIKIIRGYKAACIHATQELNDFISSSGSYGISLLNNTPIMITLKLEEKDCKLLQEHAHLTDEEAETIMRFRQMDDYNEAMLIVNRNKTKILIKSTDMEDEYITKYKDVGR